MANPIPLRSNRATRFGKPHQQAVMPDSSRRPMFLRGLRRFLVRFDMNAVEVAGVVVLLLLVAAIGVSMLFARTPAPISCPPPADHQVLTWAWVKGAASCQYMDRSPLVTTSTRSMDTQQRQRAEH